MIQKITAKRFLAIIGVLLLMSGLSLFASGTEDFQVNSIQLNTTGITNTWILKQRLGLHDEPYHFKSYEELEQFASEIKQDLDNMRIFNQVTYDIMREPSGYILSYRIEDTFTTLPIPYGKYDTNYGLKAGIKVFDHNLLGTLTDLRLTSYIRQIDNTWDTREQFTTFTIQSIPFFGNTLDATAEYAIINDNGAFQSGSLDTTITANDISLGKIPISFELSTESNQVTTTWEWYHTVSTYLSFDEIPFFDDRTFAVASSFTTTQDSEDLSQFTNEWDVSTKFRGIDILFTDIDLTTGVTMELLGEDAPWTAENIYLKVSDSYRLPLDISYSTSSTFDFDIDAFNTDLTLYNSLSYGRTNWKGDFREGTAVSVSNTLTYDFDYLMNPPSIVPNYTLGTLTSFHILGDVVNAGFRLNAMFAAGDTISFMNDSDTYPAEYLRGILNKSFESYTGTAGAILNSHLQFSVYDLDGIGELFGSLFFDYGIFHDASLPSEYFHHITGGIELITIFDALRSYPFNASIGANLEDVYSWLHGDMSFWSIEYEISMSLELFY